MNHKRPPTLTHSEWYTYGHRFGTSLAQNPNNLTACYRLVRTKRLLSDTDERRQIILSMQDVLWPKSCPRGAKGHLLVAGVVAGVLGGLLKSGKLAFTPWLSAAREVDLRELTLMLKLALKVFGIKCTAPHISVEEPDSIFFNCLSPNGWWNEQTFRQAIDTLATRFDCTVQFDGEPRVMFTHTPELH